VPPTPDPEPQSPPAPIRVRNTRSLSLIGYTGDPSSHIEMPPKPLFTMTFEQHPDRHVGCIVEDGGSIPDGRDPEPSRDRPGFATG